jgi:hypothetical protein
MADFLFVRFPEPLSTAAGAWRAMSPLTNPEAPKHSNQMATRYLLFTIIYASVLFFAGITGKFRWPVVDVAVLVLGALTLVTGVTIMLGAPRA